MSYRRPASIDPHRSHLKAVTVAQWCELCPPLAVERVLSPGEGSASVPGPTGTLYRREAEARRVAW